MGILPLLLAAAAGSVGVSGQLRLPGPVPDAPLVLTLRAPDRAREDVVVRCPIAADGSFRCSAPAGLFDVRAAIAGFQPVYRWNVEFKEPQTKLGDLAARRGASIVGWVVDSRHHRPLADASVELLERGEPPAVRQTTKSNGRGFFQFAGVDPGSYALRATVKGASPAHAADVVVREREETAVKELAVSPLSRLSVNIAPPVRSPQQEWKIEAARQVPMTRYSRTVARTFGGPMGTAEFTGLESGLYHVIVRDASGTVFASETLSIDDDPPPLFIRIAAVPIRGRLASGTTGLKAHIDFNNVRGSSLRLESDDNGDFEGLLPAEGRWLVGVVLPSRQDLNLRPIEVKRRDGEEYARIDLSLPAGRLEGRVVDERGDGVGTSVRLTRGRMPASAMLSDAGGHFTFIGLEPSDAVVDAGDGDVASGPIPVSISDAGPPLTITVRKTRTLQGWITTPAGYPVAGAAVQYWGEGDVWGGQAVSNPSGAFDLKIAGTPRYVDVFVAGGGIPVMLRRVAVPRADERIQLVTAAVPGRLLVPVREGAPPYPTIVHDGVTTTLDRILWPGHVAGVPPQGATPDGFLFDVDPGPYTVCIKSRCKTVDVPPAAQMNVDVYR